MNPKRLTVALLALLGLAGLVAIPSALAVVEFQPAHHFFSRDRVEDPWQEFTTSFESLADLSLGEAVMLFGGLVLLFALVLIVLSPEARKRLIKTVLRVGLTAWVIYYALTRIRPVGDLAVEGDPAVVGDSLAAPLEPPAYVPPMVPDLLVYAVSLVIVLLFAGLGVWLYRILRPPERRLQHLARAARSALDDLAGGRQWEDTVISCYARMSAAVRDERGLSRESAMTPSEFARRLEVAGLPSGPVRRLTRLFEKARYSRSRSNQEDVNEAVTCLSTILAAIGDHA